MLTSWAALAGFAALSGLFLPLQIEGSNLVVSGSQLLWFQTSVRALCMRPGCWVESFFRVRLLRTGESPDGATE